jgi:hypothetical protein
MRLGSRDEGARQGIDNWRETWLLCCWLTMPMRGDARCPKENATVSVSIQPGKAIQTFTNQRHIVDVCVELGY